VLHDLNMSSDSMSRGFETAGRTAVSSRIRDHKHIDCLFKHQFIVLASMSRISCLGMSKVTVGDTADKLYNYKLNIGKMFDTRVYKLLIFLQSHSPCLSLKYMHTENKRWTNG